MASIIIPTFNAGADADKLFKTLKSCAAVDEIIVIDSGSTDETLKIAVKYGAKVSIIEKKDFDHGTTRNIGAKKAKSPIIVFMTQDAIPHGKDSIRKLIAPILKDPLIVISYGRQLPKNDATPFAAHLRLFNYPGASKIKKYSDKTKTGIKTAFVSNSFSAYRKDFLKKTGWFKGGLSMGEDVCAGATALKKGYKISYTAGAAVYHSHNYNIFEEFRRYFEIGYFYKKEGWILREFGRAESEGIKFIISEMKYLISLGKYHLLPASVMRNAMKYLGYKAGQLKAGL